ncbi:hypothetical protein BVRB_5g107940 [Beta vulgaris subsp. vulgaris]|nr:hypothetical protein BVRB_5g107940 [Beta vulgaris subsp. vulgaris]
MSRRKKGQSPFAQCGGNEAKAKPVPTQGERKQAISERMTLPVQKISDSKISSVPLPGFEKSSETLSARKEGFDPVAYKLMENSGYDFSNPEPMGKVGLGFTESKPVRITTRRKPIQATQYIAVEELEESEGENTLPVKMKPASIQPQSSVFDRLEGREKSPSSSPILQRLAGRCKDATPYSSKRSVFNRLGKDTQCRKSFFSRIGKSKVNSKQQWRRKDVVKVEGEFKLEKEVRSTIPSRMKRFSTLEVKMGKSLTVRGHTIVLTNQKPSIVQNEGSDEETAASCNHVTVCEAESQDEEVETAEAPKTLEDGGQSTVDDLKELSLGTPDEPRPIFVSALLTHAEEKAYLELLMEYKDVFAWSYKEMPGELRGLQGRLAYIRRFISNLAGRCHPFSHLMKKGAPFEWDESCHRAFESIKKYLSTPPVLGAPVPGKPLILYIAAQERSLGALCAQENNEGKEKVYYLSRTLVGAELNYSPIEKMCLALIFAIQKLKHYMQAHTVRVISKADPIKYILSRPVLSGRIVKWAILISQHDIVYVSQKAIKGQALADFLADHPTPSDWELSDDLPGEEVFYIDILPPWEMYFDGAARQDGAGAGVILISPEKHILTYSFVLTELCSNNVAEYQALIFGLQMAKEMEIQDLDVYGDFKLVIHQLLDDYDVKKENLIPYHKHASQLLGTFDSVKLQHVPRSANKMADALANLAATLALGAEESMSVPVCNRWVVTPLEDGIEEGANAVSVYEVNVNDWRQPLIDYLEHGKLPRDPKHKTEIRRRAPRFIYYKGTLYRRSFLGTWLRCLGDEEAIKTLEEAHSGVCGAHQVGPKLHDRIKRLLTSLCEKFKFAQRKSSMYNAPANGLAEAFNKTLCTLLSKVVSKHKRDWHEKLGEALWAYRTTYKTPTQSTPYALVYGVESVLPLEIQVPSLRIAIQEDLTVEENAKIRLAELEALDEKRLEVQQKLECYQARLTRAFNKKVRVRSFQVGDMVLAVKRPIIVSRKTGSKFDSKWDGPYVVQEVYTNGAYKIVDADGLRIGPINGKFLKRYYP